MDLNNADMLQGTQVPLSGPAKESAPIGKPFCYSHASVA